MRRNGLPRVLLLPLLFLGATVLPELGRAGPIPERPYLDRYHGETPVPDDLYLTYARLVASMQRASRDGIEAVSLPGSIRFTTAPRPATRVETGDDCNLPFARTRFEPHILRVSRESEETWLLRTATSYLRFVATHSGHWRLYDYGDKPIL